MNNAVYEETTETLRNKINTKLINNKKDYLKCTSKPSSMSHKIFDNNLVAIQKKAKFLYSLTNLHTLECVFWN